MHDESSSLHSSRELVKCESGCCRGVVKASYDVLVVFRVHLY